VADGSLSSRDALLDIEHRSWDKSVADNRVLNNAWHELVHFDTDEDIRVRDCGYDEAMRESLRKHAARLLNAASGS
jgi:hypothetical protein